MLNYISLSFSNSQQKLIVLQKIKHMIPVSQSQNLNPTQAKPSRVRITLFKQLKLNEPSEPKKAGRGEISLNIVVHSPNKTLKFLDATLLSINKNNSMNIVKSNTLVNLEHALNSCKRGIKTIFIVDQILPQQIFTKIFQNQQVLHNLNNFVCWIFIPVVEQIDKQKRNELFHSPEVELITCDQYKVIQNLKRQETKLKNLLGNYDSKSTILSIDQIQMENKISNKVDPAAEIQNLQEPEDEKKIGQKYFDDGVPGVGTYNISAPSQYIHKREHKPIKKEPI